MNNQLLNNITHIEQLESELKVLSYKLEQAKSEGNIVLFTKLNAVISAKEIQLETLKHFEHNLAA
jgi:hypothetical protein